MATGIATFSISIILSLYFSGTGKVYHNTISSALGLVVTSVAGFTLLPEAFAQSTFTGLLTAGAIVSASYTVSTLYQLIVFIKISKSTLKDFMISKSDIANFKQQINRGL